MDLITLITILHDVPYAGPVLLYLPFVVTFGAIVGTFVPAPSPTSNKLYVFAYEVLQWCALNKGQATNLTAPANTGIVAGAMAVSAPRMATSSVPVVVPVPGTSGADVASLQARIAALEARPSVTLITPEISAKLLAANAPAAVVGQVPTAAQITALSTPAAPFVAVGPWA